jgi:hypothetical protein
MEWRRSILTSKSSDRRYNGQNDSATYDETTPFIPLTTMTVVRNAFFLAAQVKSLPEHALTALILPAQTLPEWDAGYGH